MRGVISIYTACGNIPTEDEAFTIAMNEKGGSGKSGWATLIENDSETDVVVKVSPAGGDGAAHIHSAQCAPSLGPTVHPLSNIVDGVSVTVVPATLASLLAGSFGINTHLEETGAVTTCGDIPAGRGDYVGVSGGSLVIPAGSASGTIQITIIGDNTVEFDETLTVTLSNAQSATGAVAITQDTTTVTILNDDPPTVSIADLEVSEGAGNAVLTISLDFPVNKNVTVDVATADGSATAGFDYTAVSTTATILAGATSTTVLVPIIDDADPEENETFTVTLSNAANALISTTAGTATVTIIDNEVPSISVANVSVGESDGVATLTLSLNFPHDTSTDVTVEVRTADGTAIAGADYTSVSTTVTILGGETSVTVDVTILGDVLFEGNETFTVILSNPANANIFDDTATVTILDDDPKPVLSIADISVGEADGNAVLTVTLDAVSGLDVTFNYQTANETALAPGDYTSTLGTATIPAGSTTVDVSIPIVNDALDERLNERFTVSLFDQTNADVSETEGTATVTIVDDDLLPVLSIGDILVGEVDGNATLTVSLNTPSSRSVLVDVATSNGTAVAPDDYTQTAVTALSIPAGSTSETVTVPIIDDALDEDLETFTVTLSNAVRGTISATAGEATVTITDDDPLPSLSIDNVTVTETLGGVNASFTITLSPASGRQVTVDFQTRDVSATAGADYTGTGGTATFAAGATTFTVNVPVQDDNLDEADETFDVDLSNEVNATITVAIGVGTIQDDDPQPVLSIADISVGEDVDSATLTISLDAVSGQDVSFSYRTVDGTAIAGQDYDAADAAATVFAGSITTTIAIAIIDDQVEEDTELFTVELFAVANGTLSATEGTAIVTIADDDAPILFQFDPDFQVQLNAAGIVVTWTTNSDVDGVVEWSLIEGNLDQTATDSRGALGDRLNKKTHHVPITGVAGGSTIHYNLRSDGQTDPDGPYQVTMPTVALSAAPVGISGAVSYENPHPGRECLVYVQVAQKVFFGEIFLGEEMSLWINMLTDGGSFAGDVKNIRQIGKINQALQYDAESQGRHHHRQGVVRFR